MSFRTLRIKHLPDDSYEVTVDGAAQRMPDLRSLNDFIAEVDCAADADETDAENIL